MDVKWREFQRVTDADGKTLLKPGDWDPQYQWLAIARKKDRSPAFFGFQPYHTQNPSWENGNRDLSYGITDRPLYKPGDTVHLKFFLRNLGYFEPDESKWANKTGTLTLSNGRGEEAMKIENLKTDALGSLETDVIIPKDAPLGAWHAVYQIGDKISADVVLPGRGIPQAGIRGQGRGSHRTGQTRRQIHRHGQGDLFPRRSG